MQALFGSELAVTRFVATELRVGVAHLPKLKVVLDAIDAGKIEVIDDITAEELDVMASLPRKFSAADKSCLAIAEKRSWSLLTDEKEMLKECARRNIATLRTEDVLREAVRAGVISAADLPAIADEMKREANYRPRIYEATDGRCHICWKQHVRSGYARTWEVDHSVAKAKGGTDYERNLRLACIPCNRSKQDGSTEAARRAHGHTRAPLSTSARNKRATRGALVGAGIGALFGPVGVVIGSMIGGLIGYDDDDRSVLA